MENFELSSKGFELFLPENFKKNKRVKYDFSIYKGGSVFVCPSIYEALGFNLNIWISSNAREICITSGNTFILGGYVRKNGIRKFHSASLMNYIKSILKVNEFPLHYNGRLKDGVYYLKFIPVKPKK